MIDVIYPLHNRLEYVKITFPQVLKECLTSKHFGKLWIIDDNSTDGGHEFVMDILLPSEIASKDWRLVYEEIGNSTFCINHVVENGNNPYIVKIDNDILVPDAYLDFMVSNMDGSNPAMEWRRGIPDRSKLYDNLGFIMMEETGNLPKINIIDGPEKRSHIGGVGIFRREVFEQLGPIKTNGRFYGFTKYQQEAQKHGWKCACLYNCFNTNLDSSITYSRSYEYKDKGWGRVLQETKSPFNQAWRMGNKSGALQNNL